MKTIICFGLTLYAQMLLGKTGTRLRSNELLAHLVQVMLISLPIGFGPRPINFWEEDWTSAVEF